MNNPLKENRWLLTIPFIAGIFLISLSCSQDSTPSPSYSSQAEQSTHKSIDSIDSLQATVTQVVDGDTVKVKFLDNSSDTVRILGIDTPETHVMNKRYEYGEITNLDCLKAWGTQATEFTFNMLYEREITIESDPLAPERGYYDRRLAYVRINEKDFGSLLLEKGLARVYEEGESGRKTEYLQQEAKAKDSVLGLWGCDSN